MAAMTCTVEGCGKAVRSIGLCYSHYMKQYRYGTPTPEHAPRPRQDLKGLVVGELTVRTLTEDGLWLCDCSCGATTKTRTGDLNRGSARSCGNGRLHRRHLRSKHIEYFAMHDRLRRDKGAPSTHSCVDCGTRAEQWSYNHADPDELISQVRGSAGSLYSLDASYYEPRCVRCHKAYDAAYARQHA